MWSQEAQVQSTKADCQATFSVSLFNDYISAGLMKCFWHLYS